MPVLPITLEEATEINFLEGIEVFFLIALLFLMLKSNEQYKKNYFIQAFWIIGITWYCVHIMATSDWKVLPLICMLYNVITNLFLIVENKVVKGR